MSPDILTSSFSAEKKPGAPSEIPNPHPAPDIRPGKTETPDEPVVTPERPIKNPGVPEPNVPPGVEPPPSQTPAPEVPAT